ncbi:MAG: MFS transporter [Dehalococcoidia bacterium]
MVSRHPNGNINSQTLAWGPRAASEWRAATGAVALAVLSGLGVIAVWHLIAISLLMGVAWSFDLPTRQALVRDLVPQEDLTNAVALMSTAIQATRIVGPAIGGLLIATAGVSACFYITAACHVALAATVSAISIPPHATPAEGRAGVWSDMIGGFRWVLRSEMVLPLMLLALIPNMLTGPLQALMPIFARDVLNGDASTLGWMLAASGFGAVFGSLSVAYLSGHSRKGDIAVASAVGSGILVVLFAASRDIPLSLGLLVLMGACGAMYGTMTNALVQTLTPRHLQGRVISTYMMTWNLTPIGALAIGGLADAAGTPTAVAFGGAASILGVLLLAAIRPALRRV